MDLTDWHILVVGMVVIPSLVVLWGMANIALITRYRLRGRRVIGQVWPYDWHPHADDRQWGKVEYQVDGRTFEIPYSSAFFPPIDHCGKRVPVYYLPNRPERGRVVSPWEYIKNAIAAAIGLAMIALWFFTC